MRDIDTGELSKEKEPLAARLKIIVCSGSICEFHATWMLSKYPPERTFFAPLPYERSAVDDIGSVGKEVVSELLSICGVVSVSIGAYSVKISKGRAFCWRQDGIQKEVIKILDASRNGVEEGALQIENYLEGQ